MRAAFGLGGALALALRLVGALLLLSFFLAHAALPFSKHLGHHHGYSSDMYDAAAPRVWPRHSAVSW